MILAFSLLGLQPVRLGVGPVDPAQDTLLVCTVAMWAGINYVVKDSPP